MKFKEVTLWTNQLDKQKQFYRDALGFQIEETSESFSVQIGWSKLRFTLSKSQHIYHYCFLIPSNKMDEAVEWSQDRFQLLEVGNSVLVEQSPSWNAQSIYFYDGAGNIAEFIIRRNMKNESQTPFDTNQIICFNEMGLCSTDNITQNEILKSNLGSKVFSGSIDRFATNGDEEGLFLLINNHEKDTWFPSSLKTDVSPFEALVKHEEKEIHIQYKKGILSGKKA